MDGARAVAMESRDGLADEFKAVDNPVLIRGHARIEGPALAAVRAFASASATTVT